MRDIGHDEITTVGSGDAEVMASGDIENGGGPPASHENGFLASLRRRVQRATRLTHRIIGAPDYAGYLAHMKRTNPDQIPMTAREFSRSCMESKYAQPGSRCC
jgi:uncharacterized short protein YbdD (DUF466 family)